MKYDLVIAYRVYPKLSKNPPNFIQDKFTLSKICLESFKKSLEGINFKIYALLDGCPNEYEDLFKKNFNQGQLEVIKFPGIGNKKTWKKEVELLSNQNDSEIIYCAEDDYFYAENIKNMIDFIKSGKADFVTPYEHTACYTDGHIINNQIIMFKNKRYVTVQHACFTFMTTKKKLSDNKRYFLIFSDWFGSDFVVWGCLVLGLNYFRYIKLLFNLKNYTIENFKMYGVMCFFALHRFIFNRKYKLFMPIPSFATHMEKDHLAPGIDWDLYFKNVK